MKLRFGKTANSERVQRTNDADNIWGPSWHAFREGDRFFLDYDTGDLQGHERRLEITASEFADLRSDETSFTRIVLERGG